MTEKNYNPEQRNAKIMKHKEKSQKVVAPKEKKEEEVKTEAKAETEKKEEETKVEEPKKEQTKVEKKDEANSRGVNLRASKKSCMYICKFIKNKPIDLAISDLQDVINMKRAVPFKGEIPHRKGKGMMSGRYPVKAAGQFIKLLKSLKGNVLVNGMDLDKTRIKEASADWAARPLRKGGRQFKRTHVLVKAGEFGKNKEEKK
jgi:large subunit ribosomal protein L22